MADVISKDQVIALAPDLSTTEQNTLYLALNSAATRLAPCLAAEDVDAGLLAEAQLILFKVLGRQTEVQSWARDISTGPYRVGLRDWAQSLSTLAPVEAAALRELCASSTTDAAASGSLPAGCFPPASGYDRLFSPLRRTW